MVWIQHWGLGRAWFWGKLGNLLCLAAFSTTSWGQGLECTGQNFCSHTFKLEPPGRERWVLRLQTAKLWDQFVVIFGSSIAGFFRFWLLFVLVPSLALCGHLDWSWNTVVAEYTQSRAMSWGLAFLLWWLLLIKLDFSYYWYIDVLILWWWLFGIVLKSAMTSYFNWCCNELRVLYFGS